MTRFFRFGPFELDVRAGELRKHGIRIRVRGQPIQILLMLLDLPARWSCATRSGSGCGPTTPSWSSITASMRPSKSCARPGRIGR